MNLGILGAGQIGVLMARTIREMNQRGDRTVSLYAVGARDGGRAQDFARANGVEKAYGSYEGMLSDPAVDLVYIATPHSHHYGHIKLCAGYGKHILCEKAFTVTARQAEQAIRCARDRGVLITEAIWTRYQPMRAVIQEVLDSGVIGTPRMLTANLCYAVTDRPRVVDPALAGGALLDLGIYGLNFAEMVFGRADEGQGRCVKGATGVDLADIITLSWRDGRTAVITAAVNAVSDRYGVIYGTEGYLMVENINNPQGLKVYGPYNQLIKEVSCPPQLTGYEYEVMETIQCIQAGKLECPSMPHEETIHMMQVMDLLRDQMGVHYPCEGLEE